LSLKYYII